MYRLQRCSAPAWRMPVPAFLMIVLVGGCQGSAEVPVPKPTAAEESKAEAFEATGGIDPEIIAAWEQAGAKFGWEIPLVGYFLQKTPWEMKFVATPPPEKQLARPALPAFSGTKGALKGMQELPDPQAPFALDLSWATVTEADLKALGRFRHLRSLNLLHTGLRDNSLRHLSGLQQLEVLNLGANREITDAGLKELAGLKNLKMLDLSHAKVQGPGLKELAALPKLETLHACNFPDPDAACKELTALKQLRVLHMGNLSRLTDAGLKELAQLKGLELLNVAGTPVTKAGLAEIRKALPKCQVLW